VADVTYLATAEGWMYLAVVLDLFSRRIVGWAMAATQDESLVEQALSMAIAHRSQTQVCCTILIALASIPVMRIKGFCENMVSW
jgi:transposase InsO family protein